MSSHTFGYHTVLDPYLGLAMRTLPLRAYTENGVSNCTGPITVTRLPRGSSCGRRACRSSKRRSSEHTVSGLPEVSGGS